MDNEQMLMHFLQSSHGMPSRELTVYMRLYEINASYDWQEWFPSTIANLCDLTGISDIKTVRYLRDELVNDGYIEYRTSRVGKSGEFKLRRNLTEQPKKKKARPKKK